MNMSRSVIFTLLIFKNMLFFKQQFYLKGSYYGKGKKGRGYNLSE